jgi:hypothetical protein
MNRLETVFLKNCDLKMQKKIVIQITGNGVFLKKTVF